ncbi:unnamed protein product [Pylaiella littoralis]
MPIAESDANSLIVADPSLCKYQQQQQQLTPMSKSAGGVPPPLPVRKPPHAPRRRVEPAAAAAAAAVNPVGRGVSLRVPSAFEKCLELAKVMVSPQGLAMKKVTLEGFTIPVALRLLDRRQQQESNGRALSSSSEKVSPVPAVSDELSITWLEQDMFGFDVRLLTGIHRAEDVEDRDDGTSGERRGARRGAVPRHKRSKGLGSAGYNSVGRERDEDEPRAVVLSWSMGGGPAEVVLQAASRRQRDLVAVTLEMMLSGLRVAEETGESDETPGAATASTLLSDEDEVQLRQQSELGASYSSSGGELEHSARRSPDDRSARGMARVENDDPVAAGEASLSRAAVAAAAAAAAEEEVISAGVGKASAATVADDTSTTTADDGGGGRLRLAGNVAASSPPAITRRQGCRTVDIERSTGAGAAPTRRLCPRGVSFSPSGGSDGGCGGEVNGVVPALTRSRTVGAPLGRESLAEQRQRQEEEDYHARVKRQDAMARLLLAYDRAKDESIAAAWRLGAVKLKRLLSGAATQLKEGSWATWCGAVRRANEERLKADRRMWFLHAKANQDNDLLAWYHATFCREVYRRRVPFWFRETQLKPYQKAYRIVGDGDTRNPLERSLMNSCVCTGDTRYADVAAQLFTAEGVLGIEEYGLFQILVKRGAEVPTAAPRSGRKFPHPMKIRLWFNRGSLCLTAKRHKPDGATVNDHSFYLSKIKTCLLALPAASAREGEGGGGGSGSCTSSDGAVSIAPSAAAKAHAIANDNDNTCGRSGGGASPPPSTTGFGLSSPRLPSPKKAPSHHPLDRSGEDPAAVFSPGSHVPRGAVSHDEADRGAGGQSVSTACRGGGGGGGDGESKPMPPPASVKGTFAATAVAGPATDGLSFQQQQQQQQQGGGGRARAVDPLLREGENAEPLVCHRDGGGRVAGNADKAVVEGAGLPIRGLRNRRRQNGGVGGGGGGGTGGWGNSSRRNRPWCCRVGMGAGRGS